MLKLELLDSVEVVVEGAHSNLTGPSAYQNLNSAYANAYRPDYGEADTGFRKLSSSTGS
jgi:hypothetical protein